MTKRKNNLQFSGILILILIMIVYLIAKYDVLSANADVNIPAITDDRQMTNSEYAYCYVNDSRATPTISTTNISVSIADSVSKEIYGLYNTSEKEFAYCLYGAKSDDSITIIDARKVTEKYSTPFSILFECDESEKDYLGTLHSHPKPGLGNRSSTCHPSYEDVRFWSKHTGINAIMCYNGIMVYAPCD